MVGENGIKLSGGQRQRLAIARSIIKQPPVLLLDEATSAIDVRGEAIVQAALDRVSKNRTTISIAHRLSTVKKADKIIVLKNGAIAEQGTHQSLLANRHGVYYDLVHAQQLKMDETQPEIFATDDLDISIDTIVHNTNQHSLSVKELSQKEQGKYRPKGLFSTVGLFLYEQRTHWRLYALVLVSAMGCGGKYSFHYFSENSNV